MSNPSPEAGAAASASPTATSGATTTSPEAAAAGAAGAAGASAASAEPQASWHDALPDGIKTDPHIRAFADVGALAKAHQELIKLKGAGPDRLLMVPDKPLTEAPEAWAKVLSALGVPTDAADYKIELAPGAAEDAPALEAALRDFGGKARLSQDQMIQAVGLLNQLGEKAAEADRLARAKAVEDTTAALRTEFGAAFDPLRKQLGRAILDANGGTVTPDLAAQLDAEIGSNPAVARTLMHLLNRMNEPQGLPGAGAGAASAAGADTQPMTPAAAQAALNALYADKDKSAALMDRRHPQHDAVLAERERLLAWKNGRDPSKPAPAAA